MNEAALSGLVLPPADTLSRSADQLQSRAQALSNTAAKDTPAAVKKVSQEFESLFVAYLLKTMRETIEEAGSEENSGFGKGIYTELFDQELSRNIARQGALGISDLIVKGFNREVAPTKPGSLPEPGPGASTIAPAPTETSTADPTGSDLDFGRPLPGPVSSSYGWRKDPFTRLEKFHQGVDFQAPAGSEVRAASEGEVVFAGYDSGYGNTIVLQHPQGFQTRYAHLGTVSVKAGESVSSRQVLGVVGNTGHSTGPHLHFEVSRWGEKVNPWAALNE
jgi:murein DD-endopeptidase MepM/ murein hydrolase activator NlpD